MKPSKLITKKVPSSSLLSKSLPFPVSKNKITTNNVTTLATKIVKHGMKLLPIQHHLLMLSMRNLFLIIRSLTFYLATTTASITTTSIIEVKHYTHKINHYYSRQNILIPPLIIIQTPFNTRPNKLPHLILIITILSTLNYL